MYDVGQKLAQKNRCSSCHKDDYAGTQATPRTGHQRDAGFRIDFEVGLVGRTRIDSHPARHYQALRNFTAVRKAAPRFWARFRRFVYGFYDPVFFEAFCAPTPTKTCTQPEIPLMKSIA